MTIEEVLDDVCELCREKILGVFDSDPRPTEVIAGDRMVSECCFVADEIRFLEGRLIFTPEGPEGESQYCRRYYVVCRRLVIVEGGKPLEFDICGTDSPDNAYEGRNVITWQHRLLQAAPGSPPAPFKAAAGTPTWDRTAWQNEGQGNNGLDGGPGENGVSGSKGAAGLDAPDFTLIALEVETVGVTAHLRIDFDGQVGGEGGRGQDGGDGGEGMGGRKGESDNTWPGEGCDREPGHGGDAGDGGDGGKGGEGGDGGNGGDIAIVSAAPFVTSGSFVNGDVSYMNDGGNEGPGGMGGFGGSGGSLPPRWGKAGFATNQCDNATDGSAGVDGQPQGVGPGSLVNQGSKGGAGSAGTIEIHEIRSHECTDPIPLDPEVADVAPTAVCRGFATPANNVDVTLTGQHLAQVESVDVSLAGVTASIKLTSTDTQLDLAVDIAGNSATGSADLTLHRSFGPPVVLNNALEVGRFEVTGVNPSSGSRGEQVNVAISGTCFDPSAVLQQVSVSGLQVSVANVIVLDSTTIQATFDIGAAAGLGQRDVTVKTGVPTHTLVNAFTITL